MVNIYLFIELIRAASAPDVADHIKGMSLANCKFANVVVLSYDKLVAQLDWNHKSFHESICGRRLCRVLQSVSRLLRLGE